MTLNEAQKLVERAGYAVKKNHEIKPRDFKADKYKSDEVEIDDDHTIVVKPKRKLTRACPCCGKKHCCCSESVKEAYAVAKNAGYDIIPENTELDERYGDAAGTALSSICTKYITDSYYEKLAKVAGTNAADAEFLSDLKEIIGHGVSEMKYKQIQMRLAQKKSITDKMLYIAGLMHSGEGRGL